MRGNYELVEVVMMLVDYLDVMAQSEHLSLALIKIIKIMIEVPQKKDIVGIIQHWNGQEKGLIFRHS